MSNLIQQQHFVCSFTSSDSWAILSPIEQNIKRKIEAVGTPLKDWDIQINYGIKTGCNEAFIISTQKRNEILSNCKDEEERHRTAELIRPILRGRDIKRYEYLDSGLYLINTHNGVKGKTSRIHIEDYPTVKAYLDLYWDKIKSRTDQGDTPYNLRNCAYLEDFNKPKIVWKIIGSRLAFTIDKNKYIINNACYLMTGNHLMYILAFLNSSPLIWYSEITNKNKTGVGDAQVGAQNIILFPIPKHSKEYNNINKLVHVLLGNPNDNFVKNALSDKINKIYGLNKTEIQYLTCLNL